MCDITKCPGDGCPRVWRIRCVRYLAKASDRQSYFVDTPYDFATQSCPKYIKDFPLPLKNDTERTTLPDKSNAVEESIAG